MIESNHSSPTVEMLQIPSQAQLESFRALSNDSKPSQVLNERRGLLRAVAIREMASRPRARSAVADGVVAAADRENATVIDAVERLAVEGVTYKYIISTSSTRNDGKKQDLPKTTAPLMPLAPWLDTALCTTHAPCEYPLNTICVSGHAA